MIANYGYADGSGEYFITIDTDRCDGCGECVKVCPRGLFEVAPDDYDNLVARVKDEFVKKVSYICPGYHRCSSQGADCHSACAREAIAHTW
ncbi:MAG: 4Fe-4S binding protein [Chloroflexota bacterium]